MVVSLYLDSIGVSKYKDDQYIFICLFEVSFNLEQNTRERVS